MKKIVFFSNGDFGIYSLIYLIKNQNKYNYNIINVITSKKNIINNKINKIKKISLKYNIKLIYSEYINNINVINKLKSLKPDLFIVISFKYLIKKIWKIPKLGTINIHPSLLPNYKGANPINWCIINGENIIGLTSFFINEIIDEGNIILQKKYYINNKINFDKLYYLLSKKVKYFLIKNIKILFKNKKYNLIKNEINNNNIKLAPKLNNYYTKIYFLSYSLIKIYNLIRGLPNNNAAWSFININNKINILFYYKIKIIKKKHNLFIGNIILKNKKVFIIVKNGYIKLLKCKFSNNKIINNIDIYNSMINYKLLFVF
ncbi:MAG: hypothetical protein NHG05_00790 [Candidatus Shikimatogenerans bostrichidophilus]|nr:MAG: hypothetical protein NHG05_00790 [Candidatus Shikimatogenerans bostrichidophilus]